MPVDYQCLRRPGVLFGHCGFGAAIHLAVAVYAETDERELGILGGHGRASLGFRACIGLDYIDCLRKTPGAHVFRRTAECVGQSTEESGADQ